MEGKGDAAIANGLWEAGHMVGGWAEHRGGSGGEVLQWPRERQKVGVLLGRECKARYDGECFSICIVRARDSQVTLYARGKVAGSVD